VKENKMKSNSTVVRHLGIASLLTAMGLSLSGCALFEEPRASLNEEDDYAAYSAQKNGMSDAFEELGYTPSQRLSDEEQEALYKRIKLRKLEKNLTDKEREQYFTYKPYMESDSERIDFLNLPSKQARDRFAEQRGFYKNVNKYAPAIKNAISSGDIVLGMTKDAVLESWGEPENVEVAGNQMYGNERWTYIQYNSTAEGFQKEERVVIFESGKVAGWKKY
jgi:hypothetical protein